MLDGKWIAAAEEFPPQKLRRDYRAGLANSGVLLMAGVPVAGVGILRALEAWIWPQTGNPTFMFKWPFEQNALTHIVFKGNPSRYTLLKPGCPLNSPFGAFFRHLVGGTPHRAVYHPDHRGPWTLQALHCTLRGLAPNASAQRCTPNEQRLQLNTTGCDDSQVLHDRRPVAPEVLARLRAADWEVCCAYCNAEAGCAAWSYAYQWKASLINCWLLTGASGHSYKKGFVLGRRRSGPPTRTLAYAVPPPLFGGP
jgi:hypothetical protein